MTPTRRRPPFERVVSQRDAAVVHPDGYVEIRDRFKD